MKKKITLIILALFTLTLTLQAAEAEKIGAILKLKGQVMVRHAKGDYSAAYKGQMLLNGDWIQTGDGDFAALIFLDGTQLKLSEAAELELKSDRVSAKEQNTELYLEKGELWTHVQKQKDSDFRIATPVSVAAVKGTEFNLNYDDAEKSSELFVFEGVVEFQNELGRILAREMTYSVASLKKAPAKAKKMKENKAPDWQDKIKVEWGFRMIPEKSGSQPVNVPLRVAIQVSNLTTGNAANAFSETATISSQTDRLKLSVDNGSSWTNEANILLKQGKGSILVKATQPGTASLVIGSENTESRKLDMQFMQTKSQKGQIGDKVTRIAQKRDLDGLSDKIEGKSLKTSKVVGSSDNIDAILQKVDTGEYEVVDVITTQNEDGSVSVRLKVKPKKK